MGESVARGVAVHDGLYGNAFDGLGVPPLGLATELPGIVSDQCPPLPPTLL